MWIAIRIVAAIAGIASLMLSVPLVGERQDELTEWRQQEPFNAASALPPLESTIAEVYYAPPEPGRRVILQEPISVRDTLRNVRPVLTPNGNRMEFGEELIFIEDSRTGQRLAILQAEGTASDPWVELVPMPRDVSRIPAVNRWTPLAHWKDIWLPGWADANEPYDFMWLGITSDVLRTRDIVGDPGELPYRVGNSILAGSPGGRPKPMLVSASVLALWVAGLAGIAIAVFGQRALGRKAATA